MGVQIKTIKKTDITALETMQEDELRNEIGSYDVHQIEVTVSNFNSYPVEVTLGLNTGYSEDGITTIGKKVVQE